MSDAQLAANRENAQKSTGPRTEAGKQRSSENSLRHGLRSTEIFVLPGEEELFEFTRTSLQDDLRPAGELEGQAFERILHASWRMHRCRVAEATLTEQCLARGNDPLLDDEAAPKFRRLEDYLRRAECAYTRAMKELRTLQTDRHLCEVIPENLGHPSTPGISNRRVVFQALVSYERAQPAYSDRR